MEARPLAFVSNRNPSDGALNAAAVGGGGIALLMPPSPLHEPDSSVIPFLNLGTYTAGEDAGRLAMLAKELGLSKMRRSKPQVRLRKHAFEAFLRNIEDSTPAPQSPRHKPAESSPSASPLPPSSKRRHPPLRFVFSGYSLWLELEQKDIDENGQGDLDRAMIDAADEFCLGGAIPSPHVTALYGIDTIVDEDEIRRLFREDVKRIILEQAEKRRMKNDGVDDEVVVGKLWPDLAATGIVVDVEFDGVNGGTMDMAWAEVSFMTSTEHEMLINALYDIFYRPSAVSEEVASAPSSLGEEKKDEYVPRSQLWVPHLSLCYDNPEGLGPNISRASIEGFMRKKCPTLKNVLDDTNGDVKFTRSVSGISLWRTAGTMDQWKCLDRFEFPVVG